MIVKKIHYGHDPEADKYGNRAFYWPQFDQKRRELYSVRRNRPDVYESTYQCRPGQRVGSIFLESDFVYYNPPPGLALGVLDPDVRKFLSQFQIIVAGWDTAFEASTEANYTVGIVAGLLPCESYHRDEDPIVMGNCEPHHDVYILDIMRAKLTWGDLPKQFRSFHQRWRVHTHVVEKRGAGISLYQSMPTIGIHVEGVDVKEGKRNRAILGVEAGSTQGWFRQHRVYLPYNAEWLVGFKTEMKDFTGDRSGEDDQVDAIVHLVNYAIRTGSAVFMLPSEWKPETVDTIMEVVPEDTIIPRTLQQTHTVDILNWLITSQVFSDNPYDETCGYCANNQSGFCSIQQRRVAIFDSCIEFAAVGS